MVAKLGATRQTGRRRPAPAVRSAGYTEARMPECPICRREYDDRFSVFVPPHPEGFDSIECAQRAASIWGTAEVAPVVLPMVEVVPPPPAAEAVPVAAVPRRRLAALAALALVPSQAALAGGVGLAAAGTAASIYIAARPVVQSHPRPPSRSPPHRRSRPPRPRARVERPRLRHRLRPRRTRPGRCRADPSGPETVDRPAKASARRTIVSTRPARRVHAVVAAKARFAPSSVPVPEPIVDLDGGHRTARVADGCGDAPAPVDDVTCAQAEAEAETEGAAQTEAAAEARPRAEAEADPRRPRRPPTPTATPPQQPSSPPASPTVSTTRVVASVQSSQPPKEKKKQAQPSTPTPQSQPQPQPQAGAAQSIPTAASATAGQVRFGFCDDGKGRPGNGWGDDNHDHTGPPGQGGNQDSNDPSQRGDRTRRLGPRRPR